MIVLSKIVCNVFVAQRLATSRRGIRQQSSKTGRKTQIYPAGRARGGWCRFCSSIDMEPIEWPRVFTVLLILLLAGGQQARAQRLDHVRTDSGYLRSVIATGVDRSPTFRAIVDRLEASDLIVEVQCGQFKGSMLAGRTVFLSARPTVRYLLVEIACPMPQPSALGIIAHELRHALEIGSAPWVVDEPSLGRLYTQIGFSTCGLGTNAFAEYETSDALETGERVRYELFHPAQPAHRIARNTKE
jgi:hypothetical protein